MRNPHIPFDSEKLAIAAEMREMDRIAIDEYKIPGIDLMENAAHHIFSVIKQYICDPKNKKFVVICGKGNNGGDGFAVSRLLIESGAIVSVYLLGAINDIKGDAETNLKRFLNIEKNIYIVNSISDISQDVGNCDVIIDAMFGTGFKGDVTGLPYEIISAINSSGKTIVSVDIPSGLDADSGFVSGICVNADYTATFALGKIGLFTYPGATYAGKVIIGDIGIPHELYKKINVEIIRRDWVSMQLPDRKSNSHKGTYGTSVVIAGSRGMSGAAVLAAESVLRAGAGLSILCVPQSLQQIMMIKLVEVMTDGLEETVDGMFSPKAVTKALRVCEKASSVVIGCGMGQSDETVDFIAELLPQFKCPVVIDADGLNCVAKIKNQLPPHNYPYIFTPHPAELARLLGTDTESIQSNRIEAARTASSLYNSIVVLKGAGTVIAHPNGFVRLNTTGNPGMATGGTGDVLAGVIGGLLAQGINDFNAASCGVYIHGIAGDLAAEELGEYGMIAGDLMRKLPLAIKYLVNDQ